VWPNGRCAEEEDTMRIMLALAISIASLLMISTAFAQTTESSDEGAVARQIDPTDPGAGRADTTAPNPVVLKVNGEPIYAVEISMVMQTIQNQLQDRGENVDQREIAKVATSRAIEQKLLVQEARRFGIEPDELRVARAAQVAEEQAGGRVMLEAKLKNTGSSYEQFLGVIREIEIMKAFIETQVQPNVVVSEQEIAAYYEDNPTLFDADERAHAYHMIFIVGEDARPADLDAARKRAEAARSRCVTGEEDFTVVARELSEGPSAPTGGDLGWVDRGQLVSPLSEAIFELQPGEISPVVQTRFGFHVATISDRRPAERISLDEAGPQIEGFLRQQKATEAVGQLLEMLVKNATIENLLGGEITIE
jgi:parvulin-like peptidyl-prolyl isomerase